MQTNDPALNAAYWSQQRELLDAREQLAAKDLRIAELEAALAEKREAEALPDIRITPPLQDRKVFSALQNLWNACQNWRFDPDRARQAARDAALIELKGRLLVDSNYAFETLC